MQRFSLGAALALHLAAAQPLTLQPCNASFAAEVFANGTTPHDKNGLCLGIASSAVTAQACVPGQASQSWSFHADGTVESLAQPGQCWNAYAGQTAIGTPIILYACGVIASRVGAANDYFIPQADGTILGTESSLCVSSVAVPPPPPPPPGTCTSDFDCSLNGECQSGQCQCYPPWTASLNCESLAFAPSPLRRGYPEPGHNETTWGGSIALDPVGGLYHMFVAEMMNECPLSTWGQNSRCTHATSPTPLGPFTFSDVAVQNWCHNPAIIFAPGASGGPGLWALFHIGDGTGGNVKNCTPSSAPYSAALHASGGSSLHISTTGPSGPFVPAPPLPSCNNPAPFLAKNGTWLLVCNGFQLYSAPGAVGPWTLVTSIHSSAGTPLPGNYEDPFFFIDARGNFHVIYHVYRTGGAEAHNCLPGHDGSIVSGHYFSKDGFTWHASAVEPYGNVVDLEDGSQQLLTTRERPKMIFNSAGDPTHLSNGVCPSPGNFNTPISCPTVSTGCV